MFPDPVLLSILKLFIRLEINTIMRNTEHGSEFKAKTEITQCLVAVHTLHRG